MTTVKLSDITPDDRNANAHTERGTYMLRRSIERFGFLEPGVLDADNNIIGGNSRLEAAADVLDAGEAIVIDIDGTKPVFVRRRDLRIDSPEGRGAAVAMNRSAQVGIEFDPFVLEDYALAGVDLGDWFQTSELRELGVNIDVTGNIARPDYGALLADMMGDIPMPEGVPDSLWPTDNEWGVPLLDIERQANAFDVPIETWGAKGRGKKAGTYHFYTEDSRFATIWQKPDMVVQAGCVNAVEPNFSVYDQFPRAVALWATFRKRWLARYWQSCGIRIFVDLNVARPYDDLNMLGVPRGWLAYATRGYESRLDGTAAELEIARTHAGTSSVLFLVYGGSAKVRDWCNANGAVWVAEDMDRGKGKYLDALGGSSG
jgi:hypothetical protein